MKCYTHQLAFAAAATTATFYAIGALLVKIFPIQMIQLWAPLCYLRTADLFLPFIGVPLAGFVSGIIQSFLYTYLYAWLLGSVYNKLMPNDS
ncbi:MAG: hypothetical protein WD055_06480 [Candidatus Dependentiae bacterium]